jgi:hypothetical protein
MKKIGNTTVLRNKKSKRNKKSVDLTKTTMKFVFNFQYINEDLTECDGLQNLKL